MVPKMRLNQLCIQTTVFCPSRLTTTVSPPNSSRLSAVSRWLLPNPKASNSAASVRVPVITLTASQPIRLIQLNRVGATLPFRPKITRESVSVEVRPRLPAKLVRPTSTKLATPTSAASTDCRKDKPKPTIMAPYTTPRMPILAADQIQNSSMGLPVCSASGTRSIPVLSTFHASLRLISVIANDPCSAGPRGPPQLTENRFRWRG